MEVITKNEKKGYSLFSILILLIIAGLLFMLIESLISNKIENSKTTTLNKIESSAKKYVNDNKEFFDSYFDNNLTYFELPIEVLKDNEYINIKKYGYIKITKSEDYEYEYIETKGESLYKTILNNNIIVNSDSGLYINDLNNDDVYDLKYVFKGNDLNNYIKIDSVMYRIIGITNSYTIKAIREEYNTNINSFGVGEDINYLKEEEDLKTVENLEYLKNPKTNKYFIEGLHYVGYINPESISLIDVYKDEKNNIEITKDTPIYLGYASLINVSDLLISSINNECMVNNINACDSYIKDLIEDGLVSSNATSTDNNYSIYKLKKDEIETTVDTKFEKHKEVVYIKGTLDKMVGNGSINDPYKY